MKSRCHWAVLRDVVLVSVLDHFRNLEDYTIFSISASLPRLVELGAVLQALNP